MWDQSGIRSYDKYDVQIRNRSKSEVMSFCALFVPGTYDILVPRNASQFIG